MAGQTITAVITLRNAGAKPWTWGGGNPFRLDSAPPTQSIKTFMDSETRFAMLARSHPDAAERLVAQAQKDADRRYKGYQEIAAAHAPAAPKES